LKDLLASLGPSIEDLLARHREAAANTDWSYRTYLPLERYHADARVQRPLSPVCYTAVETALLTEVNLPWYTSALYQSFQRSLRPIEEFIRLWSSEEDQHSTLLETYLLLTDNGDHDLRGRIRKQVLAAGWDHDLQGPFEGIVYTAIQELQTRAFYIHTANACEPEDPLLARALRRLSADETLHMAFYRDVVKLHLEADPEYIVPLTRVVTQFRMPGHVIPDYAARHEYLSEHVFGPAEFLHDVVEALCAYWRVDELAPDSAQGRGSLERLRSYRRMLNRLAQRRALRRISTVEAPR